MKTKSIWYTLFVGFCIFIAYKVSYSTIEHYTNDPILKEIQKELSVLHPKFRDVDINQGNKSYTINKKKVYICLKDENDRYYNKNMLVYVVLHEYAHILCKSIGHSSEFFEIFRQLLNKAAQMGLYDPNIPPVKNYCGHT